MKQAITNTTSCLQFWYYIHESASLKIYTANNISETLSWEHRETTDGKWVFGQTAISGGQFDVSFVDFYLRNDILAGADPGFFSRRGAGYLGGHICPNVSRKKLHSAFEMATLKATLIITSYLKHL